MTFDDVACDLLDHRCICGGTGVVHLGSTPVPCPDCGDV